MEERHVAGQALQRGDGRVCRVPHGALGLLARPGRIAVQEVVFVLERQAEVAGVVLQLRDLRIRVNGVAPGPVLPPTDPANREKGGDILLPRRPTPSDVASAVAFLLGADAVTGQVLAVDSGQSLARLPVDVSPSVL